MADELVTALLKESNLRAVLVTSGALVREARQLQQAEPASAALMAQGLTAAILLGALQKGPSRINLQVECDGALRGFFADANARGEVRGYVKNPNVQIENAGEFRWRPALGNSGFLSVLRDLGRGEYYRSSVELSEFDVQLDLERYFAVSDQLETVVVLALQPAEGEPLGGVAGLLVQPLPDGDREELERLRARLRGERPLETALAERPDATAAALLTRVFAPGDVEVMSRMPALLRCECSRERVLRALTTVGPEELEDMIRKDGRAEVTCHFCSRRYEISGDELRALLSASSPPTDG